jgi:hypothetical protein
MKKFLQYLMVALAAILHDFIINNGFIIHYFLKSHGLHNELGFFFLILLYSHRNKKLSQTTKKSFLNLMNTQKISWILRTS